METEKRKKSDFLMTMTRILSHLLSFSLGCLITYISLSLNIWTSSTTPQLISAHSKDLAWTETSHSTSLIKRQRHFPLAQNSNEFSNTCLLSWSFANFEPGGSSGRHIHVGATEVFHVISGKAVVETFQEHKGKHEFETGDSFAILEGLEHNVINEEEDSQLVVVYSMLKN